MRKTSFTKRLKAAAVSLVMAATAIPVFNAATAAAVPSSSLSVSATKNAIASITDKDGSNQFEGYTADYATSGLKTISITFETEFTGTMSYGFGINIDDADNDYWMEIDGSKFIS